MTKQRNAATGTSGQRRFEETSMGQRPTVDNPSGPKSPVTPEFLLGTLPVLLLPLFGPELESGVAEALGVRGDDC